MFGLSVVLTPTLASFLVVTVLTMVSISSTTVRRIKQVMQIESKPKRIEDILLSNLKKGIKIQKLVAQKDFLENCVKKKICPPEIESLAKRIGGKSTTKQETVGRYMIEEKRILMISV